MGKEMWEIRKVLGEGGAPLWRVAAPRSGMREEDERDLIVCPVPGRREQGWSFGRSYVKGRC